MDAGAGSASLHNLRARCGPQAAVAHGRCGAVAQVDWLSVPVDALLVKCHVFARFYSMIICTIT